MCVCVSERSNTSLHIAIDLVLKMKIRFYTYNLIVHNLTSFRHFYMEAWLCPNSGQSPTSIMTEQIFIVSYSVLDSSKCFA